MSPASPDLFSTLPFWAAVLGIATPLVFGTLGASICGRVGVLNLGIEGIMVAGAFAGWLTVYQGGGPWSGVLMAAVVGALLGALHGWLTIGLALSPPLSGIGVGLAATGVANYAYRIVVPQVDGTAVISLFAPMSWLPVPILNLQGPMTLLALVAVAVVGWVLYATPVGLAMRMVGENPRAVERQGLGVAGIRWGALVAGSALMGVGGACFTLAAYGGTGAFDAGLVDGRGWICMALAVFASWKPGRAALATLLFAALDAWQLAMQPPPAMGLGAPLLAQLVRMLPYVLAIAALVVVARRTSYPQAWMKPYRKGER